MSNIQFTEKTEDVQIKLIFPLEFNNTIDEKGH